MAVDMFIKLGATSSFIKGESLDKAHAGEIDVLSFSMGATRPAGGGSGTRVGAAEFHDFSFVMYVDLATPKIVEHVATGKVIDQALLTARKPGEKPVEFLKWTFSNVTLTNFAQGLSGGEDRGVQEVSFAYQKVKVEYQATNSLGNGTGWVPYEFDLTQKTA